MTSDEEYTLAGQVASRLYSADFTQIRCASAGRDLLRVGHTTRRSSDKRAPGQVRTSHDPESRLGHYFTGKRDGGLLRMGTSVLPGSFTLMVIEPDSATR